MRINELAKELELKAKVIIDALPEIGISGKRTHSSAIGDDEAAKIRRHFKAQSDAENTAGSRSRASRDGDEIKPKIDLSRATKPGDVASIIAQKTSPSAPVPRAGRHAAAAPGRQ